jgi:macrolide-specific efflux system membrane fusion protein
MIRSVAGEESKLVGRVRRRKVLVPAVVVLVAAVGAGVWALTRPSAASPGVAYRETTVSTGTIRQAVSATGTIQPADTEDLSFSSSGEVTGVYVTVGQAVTKGQRLATIDSATLRSAVAQANAAVAAANARLSTDETNDASTEQIASDNANITVAAAQLTAAKSALADATLTAPIAGTVTAVNVTAGEQVAAGSSSSGSGAGSGSGTGSGSGSDSGSGSGSGTGSGTGSSPSASDTSGSSAAVQVVSTGSYVINASVDSTDIKLIKKANQVVITPSGSSTNVFGLVSSVGIVATSTSGVASFPVVVDVTGSPAGLYAGATANLQIVYKQLSDVLVVPTLAVSRSGGETSVLVQNGQTRTQRTVVTGVSSGGQTQIVSGLTDGEQILVPVATGNQGTGDGGGAGTGNRGEFPGGGRFPGGGGGASGAPGGPRVVGPGS